MPTKPTSIDPDPLDVTATYRVPFLWRDAKRAQERFSMETPSMPVRVRGVAPASVRAFGGEPDGDGNFPSYEIEGRIHNVLATHCVARIRSETGPTFFPFYPYRLPDSISPPQSEMRRDLARMRAASIEHPGELAAARIQRLVGTDIVHDGTRLYLRHGLHADPEERMAASEADILRSRCCDVIQAAERVIRARGRHAVLSRHLAQLKRATLPALLLSVPDADRPGLDALLHVTATIVAWEHPNERTRSVMRRLAGTLPEMPEEDGPSLAALAP
jgi:hypothetical protein